jgi:IS30 family transposase
MSDARASAARAGIDLAPQELVALDELVTPLVLQGQSLWHIWATHRDTIGVCPATLYNYLNAGLFGARRLNLPRAVRFRPRHTGKGQGQDRRDIGKRSYADYLALCAGVAKDLGLSCEYYHDGWDVEFDTVIGRPGGKCLFTIVFVTSELFLARLLDKKTQECAIAAFDWLEKVFRRHVERRVGQPAGRPWWFFNTALTDNGTEMKDFASFERSVFAKYDDPRCSVFYCDPYSSWQKPRIEVAHTLLRRVLPKGTSFEHLTQTDIDRVCSHINSYARENLMGAYPFEVAPTGFCGDGLYKALGLSVIAPDDINLTPGLLSR